MPPVIEPTTGMIMSPTIDCTMRRKGGADDHADGKIDHVAAQVNF